MSKTPYELRHELLMLAQSILSEQNMNDRVCIENNWNMDCEMARTCGKPFPKFPVVPQYDVDQVITMAEKLNAFVSKND